MNNVIKAIMVIIGLLIVGSAVSGLTSGNRSGTTVVPAGASSTAAAAAAPAKVGDTVRSGNWAYTVTKVDKTKSLQWSEFGNKIDALGQWVIISLTLRNIGNQNFSINTFDFKLTESSGVLYDTSSKLEAYSYIRYKKLTNLGEQFPPGVDVMTALVFDVNPAATGLRLVLKQANNTTIALE